MILEFLTITISLTHFMTYQKSYLLFFVLQRNKKKIHVLHDVLNTYFKLNIAIIHQTVTNKNKESSPAKPVIHFQCSRQKLYSAIKLSV